MQTLEKAKNTQVKFHDRSIVTEHEQPFCKTVIEAMICF